MTNFKNPLIVCAVVAMVFLLFPLKAEAYEVSSVGGCSVPNSHPDAWRFYYTIKSFPGWTGNFYKQDTNSKEIHYKRMSLGGQNNAWVDSSDIHYHISHGGTRWDSYYGKDLTAIIFEDGDTLVPSEARRAWGDTDLEWIGFRNCKLLNNASKGYWANAMNRLHLLLGFKTNSSKQDNFGKIWAQKMRKTTINILWWTITIPGQTVTQAWFSATDATQPSGTTARVLAEVHNNYNDHLWGNGYTSSDPSANGWYWYWDHVAGSPPYLPVSGAPLQTMIVYEVVPRTVDKTYVQTIGRAFGLTGEVGQMCDSLVMADLNDPANPKIMEISKTTGHFNFHNDGRLFVADLNARAFPESQAPDVAQSFLQQHGLLPQDAGAFSVEFDTITEQEQTDGVDGRVRQTLNQNTSVVYARQITASPAGGPPVSVAGAGARLKVYLAEDGTVMGAMGNWRDIEPMEAISVNDSQKTWSLFVSYGDKVAIEPVLVDYDEAIPDFETATQAYYEYSSHTYQTELIPCWIFEVDYLLAGRLVLTADTFIPAALRYVPPVVEIIKPAEFDTFNEGDTVDFDCQVEEAFGTPPYTFKWESSVDGVFSTRQAFQINLLSVHCPNISLDCRPLPHTITVTVTDAKGIKATDTITITVDGPCDECTYSADLNGDNVVDIKDLALHAARHLMQTGHGE